MHPFDDGFLAPGADAYGAHEAVPNATPRPPRARASAKTVIHPRTAIALAVMITVSVGVVSGSAFEVGRESATVVEALGVAASEPTSASSEQNVHFSSHRTRVVVPRADDDLRALMEQAGEQALGLLREQGQDPNTVIEAAGKRLAAWNADPGPAAYDFEPADESQS